MSVKFEKLPKADLVPGEVYEGKSGKQGDVLKELLEVSNGGGFRYRRPLNNEGKNRNDKYAFVTLAMVDKNLFQNEFDEVRGLLKYYGDNSEGPNFLDTGKRGNAILKEAFDKLNYFNITKDIPPFFVFQKTEGANRKFLGLAVPGHPDIPSSENLKLYKGITEKGEEFLNYVSYFTILDTGEESISREWIKNLVEDNENSLEYAPTAWRNFIENGREGIKPLEVICDYEKREINNGCNKLYYGVPGSGKSHKINEDLEDISESQKERVLFHPDYTYSDFIGQILPKVENGEITYPFTPGPFTRILEKAFHDPDNPYYLIIEEINRGNAPAIFGDVFQLLDREKGKSEDKKDLIGTSEYSITNLDIAQSIYNNAEFEKYGEKVRIPSNLSIYATMNTSDQNVFTLDTAFQRRWNMEMIVNKIDNKHDQLFNKDKILDIGLTWKQFCYGINKIIIEENSNISSSEDKRMGTYFIKAEDFVCKEGKLNNEQYKKLVEVKSKLFSEKVLKYLWDDGFKFSREKIFNTKGYGSLDLIIEKFNHSEKEEKFVVFAEGLYEKLNIDFKTESGEE